MAANREDVLRVAAALANRGATIQLFAALRGADVAALLLKGISFGRWLYDDDAQRPSSDIDVLVSPADVAPAEAVLTGLGFVYVHDTMFARMWRRADDGVTVDLHHGLPGVTRDGGDLLARLSGSTETMEVDGVGIVVLDEPARALHAALHAAGHGIHEGRPLDDLARAIGRTSEDTWRAAASKAADLGATASFAAGLRLVPAGERLAEHLGLATARPTAVALRAATPPALTEGLLRLLETRGARARLALVARELFPAPGYLRTVSPLARRGKRGLVAAYAGRLVGVAAAIPQALGALARAHLESRRGR